MSDVWTDRLKALGIVIAAIAGLVTTVLGAINHQQVSTVQEHQAVNSQKIDDTQKKVEEVHDNVTAVKKGVDKAETTAAEVKKTLDAMK